MPSFPKPRELRENLEQALLGKLIGSTTAQSNWYINNPTELYFVARHSSLLELSTQIIDHYEKHRGTDEGIVQRDKTYMKFHEWLLSDEFQKSVGPTYKFHEPYVAGSAYTPLRRNDSDVDVFVKVSMSDGTNLTSITDDVRNTFVKAFSQKFAVADGDRVIVGDNMIKMMKVGFVITVRFVVVDYPPFGVRMSIAMNQYDDFLENFSALAFFLHSFFNHLRLAGTGTEKLVVPTTHCINILLIHFLQYYEQIPNLFQQAPNNSGDIIGNLQYYSIEDIYKHQLAAYETILLDAFQDYNLLRRDRKPTIGDLLVMFFFHYGYLVDLPHVVISPITGDISYKMHTNCFGLMICDLEEYHGKEVPDVFKLQFLCRDAFLLIKDTSNPMSLLPNLLSMRLNASFNYNADENFEQSQQAIGGNPCFLDDLLKEKPEYYLKPENHTDLRHENGFDVTYCSKYTIYTRNWKTKQKARPVKEKPLPPFSDEMHSLKKFLQKPVRYEPKSEIPVSTLCARSSRMFQMTVLPNPNNLSQLNIIFRPPVDYSRRLYPITDYGLEPGGPGMGRCRGVSVPSFTEALLTSCYREMQSCEKAQRTYYHQKRFNIEINENQDDMAPYTTGLSMSEFAKDDRVEPLDPPKDPLPRPPMEPASKNKKKNKKKKNGSQNQVAQTNNNFPSIEEKMKTLEISAMGDEGDSTGCSQPNGTNGSLSTGATSPKLMSDAELKELMENNTVENKVEMQILGVPLVVMKSGVVDLTGLDANSFSDPNELKKILEAHAETLALAVEDLKSNTDECEEEPPLQPAQQQQPNNQKSYNPNTASQKAQNTTFPSERPNSPSFAHSLHCAAYEPEIYSGIVYRGVFRDAVEAMEAEYFSSLEPWHRDGVEYERLNYYK